MDFTRRVLRQAFTVTLVGLVPLAAAPALAADPSTATHDFNDTRGSSPNFPTAAPADSVGTASGLVPARHGDTPTLAAPGAQVQPAQDCQQIADETQRHTCEQARAPH